MKLNEAQLLELRCRLESLISEREGMIAENHQREFLNQSPAYHEDSFFINSRKITEIEKIISWEREQNTGGK